MTDNDWDSPPSDEFILEYVDRHWSNPDPNDLIGYVIRRLADGWRAAETDLATARTIIERCIAGQVNELAEMARSWLASADPE